MEIRKKIFGFILILMSSLVLMNSHAFSQEIIYRYKADGVILGERKIIPNDPPIINAYSVPDTYTGESYSYTFSGSDPDGDSLIWSWSGNTPSGLNINSSTGEISGSASLEGTYTFNIKLSDSRGASTSVSASMSILGCNLGPVGSVCADDAVYVGEHNGSRLYAVGSSKFTETLNVNWSTAWNYCNNDGYALPTRDEVISIRDNLETAGFPLYKSFPHWTIEKYNSVNSYYYINNSTTSYYNIGLNIRFICFRY